MGCEEAPGVGLPPLEFTECLADSPQFRENLQCHEKELERTSQQIKRLIKEVKDVVSAARRLGAAQLVLANSLEQFDFASIGASMTEDERAISGSLRHLAAIIRTVEDERGRMLSRAHDQIIQPLETFRKDNIGAVKEGKKKFDKKTAKFCQTQERTLSLSARKPETVFQEADAALEMASRDFCAASLEYVFELQALQERKKFELVETLLGWLLSWGTFHHAAQDVHADAEPLLRALQLTVQRTRSNFEETSKQTECLMKKMMEVRQANKEEESSGDEAGGSNVTKAGYLFLFEKKAFGAAWSKHYCSYAGGERALTITPYNQINVKTAGCSETVEVSGARAAPDAERRFCFEALCGERGPLLLQARAAADRAAWLRALSGAPSAAPCAVAAAGGGGAALDDAGFRFVAALIAEVERRGLATQGLYRVGGVSSRAARLCALGAAGARLSLRDDAQHDTRTLTSALKLFLRSLPRALLAPQHHQLIAAAKLECRSARMAGVARRVLQLPPAHRHMLALVVRHLRRVAAHCRDNKMCASNLAVCFGPTLMRAERETVASILDIKFYNVCVETILQHPTLLRAPDDLADLPGLEDSDDAASPAGSLAVSLRDDMSVVERGSCARYSPQHTSLLQSLAPPSPPPAPLAPPLAPLAPPPAPLAAPPHAPAARRVRTLYACVAEAEGELSFEANQVICDVRASAEPGWLTGTLAGRTGLVPLNYVEPLP